MQYCSSDCCHELMHWSVFTTALEIVSLISWRHQMYPASVSQLNDGNGGVCITFRCDKQVLRFEVHDDGSVTGIAYGPGRTPTYLEATASEHGLNGIRVMAGEWQESNKAKKQ